MDPHTTQKSGSVERKMNEEEIEMDATYHCKSASRIPITGMDPSVALVSIICLFFIFYYKVGRKYLKVAMDETVYQYIYILIYKELSISTNKSI